MHECQFFNFISGTRIQDSTGNRIASSSSTNQQATDMAHVSFMQEQSKGSAMGQGLLITDGRNNCKIYSVNGPGLL